MGTPKQDAFRRDLTINSLFYNINEQKIEDWTGRVRQDIPTLLYLVKEATSNLIVKGSEGSERWCHRHAIGAHDDLQR